MPNIKVSKLTFFKEIPGSFHSRKCLLEEDVYALKNFNTHCTQTDINDQNEKLKLKTYFQDIWVLNITSSSNQTVTRNKAFKVHC